MQIASAYRQPSLSIKPAHNSPLLEKLIELGAISDRMPQFPHEALRLIVQNDLHKRFYNARNGGVSTPELDLFDWLRFMGRADLSLGRLFEGHVNALKLIEWFGTPSQNRQLQQNLDNGMLYGVWATEPSNGVTLHSLGSELALHGCKSFASGAGSIDFAIVTAQPSTGSRRLVIVPANDISRTDLSGWKVRGMRSTMSGTYDLSGFNVTADDLLGEPGEYDLEPRFTAGAWRFLAVQLGGIEALVTETRAAISEAARHDPLQRLKFANAVEAMRTAYFWVHRSAVMFEQSDKQAPAFVRMARGVVERAALEVMTLSARIVGTRSAFDGQRIDKISRDLALYLRQGGPDYARDQAAIAWLEEDVWDEDDRLW